MIVIVMGVTGAGKTTVGMLLANELGWQFADADGFHSEANKEKMRQGIPLEDADRQPWLEAMRKAISDWIAAQKNVVLACSSLKASYRELLAVSQQVEFVYLKGDYETIYERLLSRHGHFATEKILSSQFASLEEPTDAVVVNIGQSPEEIVREIRSRIKLRLA